MNLTVCKIKAIKSYNGYYVVSCITNLGPINLRCHYHHASLLKHMGKIVALDIVPPIFRTVTDKEHNSYNCIISIEECNSRMIFDFRRDNDL